MPGEAVCHLKCPHFPVSVTVCTSRFSGKGRKCSPSPLVAELGAECRSALCIKSHCFPVQNSQDTE